MGIDVSAYVGFGIQLPDYFSSGDELLGAARGVLRDRPGMTEDDVRRKWDKLSIEGVIGGSFNFPKTSAKERSFLVDRHTLIAGGWERAVKFDALPEVDPHDVAQRIRTVVELAGRRMKVDEIEVEPTWMLIAVMW